MKKRTIVLMALSLLMVFSFDSLAQNPKGKKKGKKATTTKGTKVPSTRTLNASGAFTVSDSDTSQAAQPVTQNNNTSTASTYESGLKLKNAPDLTGTPCPTGLNWFPPDFILEEDVFKTNTGTIDVSLMAKISLFFTDDTLLMAKKETKTYRTIVNEDGLSVRYEYCDGICADEKVFPYNPQAKEGDGQVLWLKVIPCPKDTTINVGEFELEVPAGEAFVWLVVSFANPKKNQKPEDHTLTFVGKAEPGVDGSGYPLSGVFSLLVWQDKDDDSVYWTKYGKSNYKILNDDPFVFQLKSFCDKGPRPDIAGKAQGNQRVRKGDKTQSKTTSKVGARVIPGTHP